jgi:hypothetical protein
LLVRLGAGVSFRVPLHPIWPCTGARARARTCHFGTSRVNKPSGLVKHGSLLVR